jgi:shikimate dehydrogenase
MPMTSASLIEKCCLIANPAAGNPAQYLIEQAFAQIGLDWRFMTFEVEPSGLGDAMRGVRALGIHGAKVGEPFHVSVLELLDELSDEARRSGSVNCVTRNGDKLIGDNTEGTALSELVQQQISLVGKSAMIAGSGRLARAVAIALADGGVESITIASRNESAGKELIELLQKETSAKSSLVLLSAGTVSVEPETAVLVNATSLGSEAPDAKLPLNPESFGSKLVVADVAFNTSRTWLTHQAAERDCRVIDGLSLYVHQTALAVRAWTNVMPDTVALREADEEFLGI